jgi:pyrroloquinoline quinone (PQQ) biosynthesis protein C
MTALMTPVTHTPIQMSEEVESTSSILEAKDKTSFPAWAEEMVRQLDDRMTALKDKIEAMEMWKTLLDPATPMDYIKLIMREIYLEIYSYQPAVIEATMCVIARMPKADSRTIKRMMMHQCDESDHGEMAIRDYVRLGGDEHYARTRRVGPAAFAVSSLWWGLAHMENPVAYLGALYPFEGLTPRVCGPIVKVLKERGFPEEAMEFINFHAVEDIKHTNLVRWLLKDVASRYEGGREAIEAGLEYFLHVYPIPGWEEAFQRAKSEWKRRGGR